MAPPLLIATRFGLQIKDSAWFEHRLTLLSAITAPSLLAQEDQGFQWAIFVDPEVPRGARTALEEILARFDGRAFICIDEHGGDVLLTLARQRGLVDTDEEHLLMGRIDDDDAWHRSTVSKVRERARMWLQKKDEAPGFALSFADGLAWVMYDMVDVEASAGSDSGGTAWYRQRLLRAAVPFLSMSGFVCARPADRLTPISTGHSRIPELLSSRGFDIDVRATKTPMWLTCRHKQTTSATLYKDIETTEVDHDLATLHAWFGIDETAIRRYLENTDKHGYFLPKGIGVRRAALRRALAQAEDSEKPALAEKLARLSDNVIGEIE